MKQIDSELTRLFAESNEQLPDRDFMLGVIKQLERIRKRHRQWKVFSISAAIAVAVFAIRELSKSDLWTSAVHAEDRLTEFFSNLDLSVLVVLLESPIAWAAVCAIAATTLPVAYVWKAWR